MRIWCRGTRGWETGKKGAGGVREARDEGAGSSIPKVAGSRRNQCANYKRRLKFTLPLTRPGLSSHQKLEIPVRQQETNRLDFKHS